MSPKTVPYDVEVSRVSLVSKEIIPSCTFAGTLANLVLLNQDNDQVGHLQTNKPRVCRRLTRSKVSIIHSECGKNIINVGTQYSPVKGKASTAPVYGNHIAILSIKKSTCHVLGMYKS